MGVGGRAQRLCAPDTIAELKEVYSALCREGEDPFVLGGGCNTIFPDRPFRRPIIHTERLRGFSVDGRRIRAEAGLRIESLIRISVESGLAGLEKFRGIPGTVGGAIAMNAGGSGREFGQFVRRIYAIDPESRAVVEVRGRDVTWSYRRAELGGLVVVGVELELVPGNTEQLRSSALGFLRWKSATQPLGSHNSGCIFKNPTGHSAGCLIDNAGLKGKRVGAAVISPRHANFIVNERGKATASDVLMLVETVQRRVRELFDVDLELEVVVARDA